MTSSPTPTVLPDARALPGDTWPNDWKLNGFNHAITQAQKALRYLADKDRPSGGEQFPNSASCHMIADELEKTRQRYAAFATQPAPDAVIPAGFVLVPIEPTERMLARGEGITDFILPEGTHDNSKAGRVAEMRLAWAEMLAAAPKVASEEGQYVPLNPVDAAALAARVVGASDTGAGLRKIIRDTLDGVAGARDAALATDATDGAAGSDVDASDNTGHS